MVNNYYLRHFLNYAFTELIKVKYFNVIVADHFLSSCNQSIGLRTYHSYVYEQGTIIYFGVTQSEKVLLDIPTKINCIFINSSDDGSNITYITTPTSITFNKENKATNIYYILVAQV